MNECLSEVNISNSSSTCTVTRTARYISLAVGNFGVVYILSVHNVASPSDSCAFGSDVIIRTRIPYVNFHCVLQLLVVLILNFAKIRHVIMPVIFIPVGEPEAEERMEPGRSLKGFRKTLHC